MFLGLGQELEGVVGGSGGPAENARHQMRIVADQLFHGRRPVVGHLEEQRSSGLGHACQRPSDQVVDERPDLVRRNRIEGAVKWIYLGLIFVSASLVGLAGHLGGKMVFGESYLPF